jgi:uncharacterized protein (DUF1697 family)
MRTYISMIRGINDSGQKKIMMTDLKTLYEELGLSEVITYIQSGNVIFNTGLIIPVKDLSVMIEEVIYKKYGFNVPVIIRTVDEMKAAIKANPFQNADVSSPEKIYITFLEVKPHKADVEKINHAAFLPDRFIVIEREIYLNCAGGYGTTKLSNTFFENKLKVKATTRNWNTVNKLVELSTND